MNIPIYRAKRKDTGEWVEGYYYPYENGEHFIYETGESTNGTFQDRHSEIYPETLAIHFPDILDKNGEKIWASLSNTDVGGSTVDGWAETNALVTYRYSNIVAVYEPMCHAEREGEPRYDIVDNEYIKKIKVTGIYEGETKHCLLYTSPSPRDRTRSRMPSSA